MSCVEMVAVWSCAVVQTSRADAQGVGGLMPVCPPPGYTHTRIILTHVYSDAPQIGFPELAFRKSDMFK